MTSKTNVFAPAAWLLAVLALLTTVAVAAVAAADPDSREPARRQIPLRDGWLVKQLDNDNPNLAVLVRESASPDKTWLTARMPAQVHHVLLAHGLIPDPHVGTNATTSAWVGEKHWAYVGRFPSPENIRGPAFLRFEGLDTLADAWLNGAPLGHFENMFREYAVEVLVVGGGPAGIGAALGAARKGARTLLIENHSFFGGVAASLATQKGSLVREIKVSEIQDALRADGVSFEVTDRDQRGLRG